MQTQKNTNYWLSRLYWEIHYQVIEELSNKVKLCTFIFICFIENNYYKYLLLSLRLEGEETLK